MQTIFVSNKGDDKNDGLTLGTPVRSKRRLLALCKGNNAMHLMEGDATFARLMTEKDESKGNPIGAGPGGSRPIG